MVRKNGYNSACEHISNPSSSLLTIQREEMAANSPHQERPIETLEYDINCFFNNIVRCVEARRTVVLETAKEKRNEMKERLRIKTEGEEQLVAAKGGIEGRIKENFLRETREKMLSKVERKLGEMRAPLSGTRIAFRGEYGDLEQLIVTLGEIWEEPIPVVVPRYEDMKSVVSAGRKGRAPGELWSPNAVAIDSNTNYIYVAEGNMFDRSPRISIFTDKAEFLYAYTHERMQCPEGIAIHRNNVYVTDTRVNAVFQLVIDSDILLVNGLGALGTGNNEFNAPANLAVSPNGNVYVADTKNNRIQVLDPSLNFIQTLAEQLIEQPRDIKLTADSVYVLCSISPCISVFSYSGVKLRSLITLGYLKQVHVANYFCLDSQENIIISDHGTHSVTAFTKKGTLIHSIGGGEEDDMFYNPRGIALIDGSRLVVLFSNSNYSLQIFTSQ